MAVHPVIAAMLEKARAAGVPALSAGSPSDARALLGQVRLILGPGEPVEQRTLFDLPTRDGTIPALLLQPKPKCDGVVVYLHGGGWVVGGIDDFEVLARKIAVGTGCAVLLPQYRLAPEHPFPAPLADCEDAVVWAWAERERLAGPGAPLVVAGDSAGGNLATVCAATLADRVSLAGQVLIYPAVDTDPDRPSYLQYGNGDVPLTRADMLWFYGHYAPPSLWSDPRIAPLRATSLRSQPPTSILLAENDVLRDEGGAYAARLREADVPVTLRQYDGMTHGFIRYHDLVDVAGDAVRDLCGDIAGFCRAAVRRAA